LQFVPETAVVTALFGPSSVKAPELLWAVIVQGYEPGVQAEAAGIATEKEFPVERLRCRNWTPVALQLLPPGIGDGAPVIVNPGGADTSADNICGPPSFVIVKLIVVEAPPVTVGGVKTALNPDEAAEPPGIRIAAPATSPATSTRAPRVRRQDAREVSLSRLLLRPITPLPGCHRHVLSCDDPL
jgi:hypothetical protein